MARRQSSEQPDPQDPISPEQGETETTPAAPRPPQGITVEYFPEHHPKAFHPIRRQIRMVDPASLVVDGKDPYLALPIQASPRGEVRIRRVAAAQAAYLLSCDDATGAASIYRIATDAEVEAAETDAQARAAKAK